MSWNGLKMKHEVKLKSTGNELEKEIYENW